MPFHPEISEASDIEEKLRRGSRSRDRGSRGWDVRALAEGIRVGVVWVGYRGSRHVRVLRTATGIPTVIGVDQRFAEIGDGRREPEHGVTANADVEDALPGVRKSLFFVSL
jgi:hypothetical protein